MPELSRGIGAAVVLVSCREEWQPFEPERFAPMMLVRKRAALGARLQGAEEPSASLARGLVPEQSSGAAGFRNQGARAPAAAGARGPNAKGGIFRRLMMALAREFRL